MGAEWSFSVMLEQQLVDGAVKSTPAEPSHLQLVEVASSGGALFHNLPAVPGAALLPEIWCLKHFTEIFITVYF